MSNELKKIAEQNKILEIVAGSHLYGTSTPQSDEDFVGVFMPPAEYVYGLHVVKEVDFSQIDKDESGKNTAEAVDRKLYEFRKFVNLALGNNPNIMEMLFVPEKSIVSVNEFGRRLLGIRHLFPSRQAVPKFMGYANSQKHKMIIRRDHFNELRAAYEIMKSEPDKDVLAQVYDRYERLRNATYNGKSPVEEETPTFWKKEGAKHIHMGDLCFEPGVYVSKVRAKLKERLEKITNRSELVLKHGYDTKFASHLIRLLHEGLDILNNGELQFPLKNAQLLLDIKNGSMSLKEVLELSDQLEAEYTEAEKKSQLPKKPDFDKVEKFVISNLREFLE